METPYSDSKMTKMKAFSLVSLSEATNPSLEVSLLHSSVALVEHTSSNLKKWMKDPQNSLSSSKLQISNQISYKSFNSNSKTLKEWKLQQLGSLPIKRKEWLN